VSERAVEIVQLHQVGNFLFDALVDIEGCFVQVVRGARGSVLCMNAWKAFEGIKSYDSSGVVIWLHDT